jgi:hypothetical protein
VSRVGINEGFQPLLAAGQSPHAARDLIDTQTKQSDGKLDLYCNGNLLKRDYIRNGIRYELGDKDEIAVFADMGVGGMRRADLLYNYELDASQLGNVVPQPKPPTARRLLPRRPAPLKPKKKGGGGRPRLVDEAKVEKAKRQLEREGKKPTQSLLAERLNVSTDTIGRRQKPKKK